MHTTKLTHGVHWSLALILALGLWLLVQPLTVSADGPIYVDADAPGTATRSEERRGGKECRSRVSPDH